MAKSSARAQAQLVRYFVAEDAFFPVAGQLLDDGVAPPPLDPLEDEIPVLAPDASHVLVLNGVRDFVDSGAGVEDLYA